MSETVNSEATRITAAELFGSSENSALAELSASENADAKASTATSEAQNEPENKQDAEKESKENGLTDDGDVSSDDAESTDDEAQDEDEKKAAKGKGVTKRIQKLVRKNKALEQELMFLREQILKSQIEGK